MISSQWNWLPLNLEMHPSVTQWTCPKTSSQWLSFLNHPKVSAYFLLFCCHQIKLLEWKASIIVYQLVSLLCFDENQSFVLSLLFPFPHFFLMLWCVWYDFSRSMIWPTRFFFTDGFCIHWDLSLELFTNPPQPFTTWMEPQGQHVIYKHVSITFFFFQLSIGMHASNPSFKNLEISQHCTAHEHKETKWHFFFSTGNGTQICASLPKKTQLWFWLKKNDITFHSFPMFSEQCIWKFFVSSRIIFVEIKII